MLIDTHAHLNFAAYKGDANEIIKKTLKQGVFIVNVGSQYSTSRRAVEIAKKYEKGVFAAVGLHPIHLVKKEINPDNSELDDKDFVTTGEFFDYEKYKKLAEHSVVVAIGEMGLDYHYFEPKDDIQELKKRQKETFLQGIKLANEIKKPMIIHCRDAYDDLLIILKENTVVEKGIIHSFVGSYKTARKFTELGYKIGLNGMITYSSSFDRLIKELRLDEIVLETDCPYLTPAPYKNERNEPLRVKLIAEKVAEIKNTSLSEVSKTTTQNVEKLFKIRT